MNRKPLILCADDSIYVLEAWKALLQRNGYDVLTAIDGKEALQLFTSHPVDLVLLDYHMPQMNGDIAAAHMKNCKSDVPVALLSSDEVTALGDVEAVDAFICKSEPVPKVLEIVDQLLAVRLLFRPVNNLGGKDAA